MAQTWTGAVSNDWTNGQNWSGGVPPSAGTTIGLPSADVVLGVDGPANGAVSALVVNPDAGSLTIQKGSSLTVTNNVATASTAGHVDELTITGKGSQLSVGGILNVGGSGTATLNILDGGLVSGLGGIRVGFGVSGVGVVNVASGGTLETTSLSKVSGSAQFNFDGGTLRALASNPAFTNTLTVSELAIAAGGLTVDTNGFSIGASGFSGTGGLTTTGAGTLTLHDASTYTGDTIVGLGSTLALAGAATLASGRVVADGTFDISAIAAAGLTLSRLEGIGVVALGGKALEAGEIAPGGNAIGTLIFDGNYAGTGALLEIQTVLGGDSSATDKLVITGNTSGTTNIAVTNMGGIGGATVRGIRIVDVGGTSAGTFALLGDLQVAGQQAVVGGAYLYGLYQGTPTNADGDWYLRSLVNPSDPEKPIFQPAAPVIESYVASALQAFNKAESLEQRLGKRSWAGAAGVGLWGRIDADHANIASDGSTTGAGYQVDTARLQAGADGVLHRSETGVVVGGFNVQIGTVAADVQSASGNGKVSSTAYGLGAGLTWYGNEGFYVDAQGSLTFFDSTLGSSALGKTIVSGNAGLGSVLSLEAGQEIVLENDWSVTPQAQMSYSHVGFDDFVDPFGSTVRLDHGDSLVGRLGLTADHRAGWQDTNGETGSARLYGSADINYEFLGGTSTNIGASVVSSKKDPLWGRIGLGGSLDWAEEKVSLFGELGLSSSLNNPGKSYGLGVTAGLKGKL